VLFTLALAGMLSAALELRATPASNVVGFALQVLSEATLGALLGLALHAAFAALGMAGRLLDLQMGFGMGAVLDPVTQSNSPVVGVALMLLGTSVFFGSEGHQALLRGLVFSVQAIPPGGLWELPDAAAVIRPVGMMFGMAVVLMAPALFVLLMVELVLGVASRVLPQMNVLFIGMPVKTLVGLSTLAIAAPVMAPTLSRLYAGVFRFWEQVLP
jgi:flagellar biosynthetic protein FliR